MKRICFFLLLLLLSGCREIGEQGAGEHLHSEQLKKLDKPQSVSTNHTNSYFFHLSQINLVANAEFYDRNTDEYVKEIIYAEAYLVKEYERGNVYKFVIEPVGELQYDRLNQYFYVTQDTIYRIWPYYYNAKENEMVIFYDDILFIEMLDTDDKLMNAGDIVCRKEEIKSSLEEEKEGIYYSVSQQGNQITYGRLELNPNGETNYYENFVWEEGKGLVEYSSGFGAMQDILYMTEISVISEAE